MYVLFEPPREKTCISGFREGTTQTGLYDHNGWLETLRLGSTGYALSM